MQRHVSQNIIHKIPFQRHTIEVRPKLGNMQLFSYPASRFLRYFSFFQTVPTQNLFDNPERIRFDRIQTLRNIHRACRG
jgi:hypothetical protein